MILPQNPSILVILLGAIGDVTRALPLVQALKLHHPQAQITWLVEPKSLGVVRLSRAVDRIVVFERAGGWRALLKAVRELRSQQYDVALDFQRHFKSGMFSFCSRAPMRIGFARVDSKEGNWLFNTHSIPPASAPDVPKIEQYLEYLSVLGLPKPSELDFGLKDLLFPKILLDLGQKTAGAIIGMVLSSSWESKDWPLAGYEKLSQLLLAQPDTVICLIGTAADSGAAEQLVAQAPRPASIFNYCGKTTLEEAAALLKACNVVVGPDSGPGHLAAAVGTPYIGLFGPTSPHRTAPVGMENLALQVELGCSPCLRRKCPGLNKICMRLISPEVVFRKIQALSF